MIGASAGFTFRYVGLFGSPDGSKLRAALIAACTSRAAPSMSRFKSNCSVMRVDPSEDDDVISVTPAMRPNARSSGVATVAAIVSGLAPGKLACTEIVGKSTCGNGATGSRRNAMAPVSATPNVKSVVATGRSMNGCDRFMARSFRNTRRRCGLWWQLAHSPCEPIEREIDHRRSEQRQDLAHDKPADHRKTERWAQH